MSAWTAALPPDPPTPARPQPGRANTWATCAPLADLAAAFAGDESFALEIRRAGLKLRPGQGLMVRDAFRLDQGEVRAIPLDGRIDFDVTSSTLIDFDLGEMAAEEEEIDAQISAVILVRCSPDAGPGLGLWKRPRAGASGGTGIVIYADFRWGGAGAAAITGNRVVKNKVSMVSDTPSVVDIVAFELTDTRNDSNLAVVLLDNAIGFNDFRGTTTQIALTPLNLDNPTNKISRNLGNNRGHGLRPSAFKAD